MIGDEGREERWCEVEDDESGEEDWPNQEDVDCDVDWVAVVCAVEGEVLFQIQKRH